MDNRITWVDSARGIAFFMVIYRHSTFCVPDLMRYFSPIFLTTFFFVSGYLHKSSIPFFTFLEHRIRTLFIPFLIYGTMMISIRYIFTFKEELIPFSVAIKGLIVQNDQGSFIWFIPSLFVYSVAFYWIERIFKSTNALVAFCGIAFFVNWFLIWIIEIPNLPYHIHHIGFACTYMGLGKIYRSKEFAWKKFQQKSMIYLIAFIYILFVYFAKPLLPYGISYYASPLLVDSILISLLGLWLCIYFSKIINKGKLCLFIGANSLLYFCLHWKALSLVETIEYVWLGSRLADHHLFISLLNSFITATLLVIPIICINRYAKFTIGKGYRLWH